MDIYELMGAWRGASWMPERVSMLVPGDTVYGWIDETKDGEIHEVRMFGQPWKITRIDDEFWADKQSTRGRRRIFHDGRGGETHFDGRRRVLVVPGPRP